MQNIKRWISLALVVCLLAMLPAAALAEDTETGTGLPVESESITSPSPSASAAEESETVTSPNPSASAAEESETVTSPSPSASAAVESETVTFPSPSASAAAESETVTSPSPSASAAAEGESITSPSPSASTAAEESETVTSPSPSIEASISPSPSAETSSAPTDAAEVKTIASFEAVAPEGLSVPQGTPETGLGLPASLSVQFADGAAGEVAVAWQCAAGYDPNAEAGAQFAFAAVLPEGYALAEGVSLPQILVTLTPPLANAMLMAQASGTGWTLSDGKLTVKGYVGSDDISSFASAQSIEICEGAKLILQSDFSGAVTVLYRGTLENDKTFSGDIMVAEDGYFYNDGTISGGTITGATVTNEGGSITGGKFSNIALDRESGELTITGDIDLSNGGSLAPLTIALNHESIKSVTVAEGASFNAGDNTVPIPVEYNGTITGGTFTGAITGGAPSRAATFPEPTSAASPARPAAARSRSSS